MEKRYCSHCGAETISPVWIGGDPFGLTMSGGNIDITHAYCTICAIEAVELSDPRKNPKAFAKTLSDLFTPDLYLHAKNFLAQKFTPVLLEAETLDGNTGEILRREVEKLWKSITGEELGK